ncbi:MAG: sulfatase [Planctomycetales bacterium]
MSHRNPPPYRVAQFAVIFAVMFPVMFAGLQFVVAEEASRPEKLNVLFIVSDDLNNDLGCYGHPLVHSPHIDRLAQRGVRFERAYCQNPLCNPSRVSFLTGLYSDQTKAVTNTIRFREHLPDVVTLPQMFRNNGYYVARVGKLFHYGVPQHIGTDGYDDPPSWEEVVNPRGIDREVEDRIHSLVPGQFGATLSWLAIDSRDEEHTDGVGATKAIELLEKHHPKKTGRPFFLGVGFYRPHTPFVAPTRHFELHPREKINPLMHDIDDREDIPLAAQFNRPEQRNLSRTQRQEIIQAYYSSVSLMDAQVGRLIDALDRLELSKNTVIVFTSDHGFHLGRHGQWQKMTLFEESARVPLIVHAPDAKGNGRPADGIVELVDLYPTLAELCGLKPPEDLAGTSLVPLLEDPTRAGKVAALTRTVSRLKPREGDLRVDGFTIRTPRYRYTEWGDGRYGVELYDYQKDPTESANLAAKAVHAETVARLKRLLADRKLATTRR